MQKICSLGLIGYGGAGSHHVEMIKKLDFLSIDAVYDIDIDKQTQALMNGLKVFVSYEDLLSLSSLDAVIIATPNESHAPLCIAALKAGKHVICEKPVTLNSDELLSVLHAAKKYNKRFIVHQNRRWDPDYLSILNIIKSKSIGEVYSIQSRVQGAIGVPQDWRLSPESAGGMLFDWGVHLIDRAILLYDEKIISIYCKLSRIMGDLVDDGIKLIIYFENNKVLQIDIGTNDLIKLPMWFVNGVNGTAVIDGWNLQGKVVERKKKVSGLVPPILAGVGVTRTMAPLSSEFVTEKSIPVVDLSINEFYKNCYDVFVNNVEQVILNEQVLRVMQIMETAIESDRTNSVIYCNL